MRGRLICPTLTSDKATVKRGTEGAAGVISRGDGIQTLMRSHYPSALLNLSGETSWLSSGRWPSTPKLAKVEFLRHLPVLNPHKPLNRPDNHPLHSQSSM